MKLNKRINIICGIGIFALFTLFCGCASTDESVKEVVFDSNNKAEQKEGSEDVEEQLVTADNSLLVTADEASSYQIEAVAPAGRDNKKNYTGWIATSLHPITNVVGNVSFYVRPKKGTFSISVINKNEKAIPVFSTANEYTSTSLYLRAGKKIIKLCDDSGVVSAAKKTEKGLKIRYSIDKVAVVIIDFECFSSVEGEPEDTVKITTAVVSQSKKKTDFSVKFIMDTVLGETDRHHFYDSEGLPVKNEVVYHSMNDEKWFTSQNSRAAMQIILAGGEATPVQSVALANYTTLDTKKWEADMTIFRSFDTVLSYNNSAVGIYWPKVSLEPDQEAANVFYISLAADERVPGGAAYLTAQKEESEEAGEESTEDSAAQADSEQDSQFNEPKETAPVQAEPPVENIEAVQEPVKEPAAEPEKIVPAVKEPEPQVAKEPVVEEKAEPAATTIPAKEEAQPAQQNSSSSGITSDKLSIDYIQKLLDRIEELEETDPDLNKAEINELNMELDAIITILNAQN